MIPPPSVFFSLFRTFVEPTPQSMFLRMRNIPTALDSYDAIDPTSIYSLLSVYILRPLLDVF